MLEPVFLWNREKGGALRPPMVPDTHRAESLELERVEELDNKDIVRMKRE
jgi:hypothetical protein